MPGAPNIVFVFADQLRYDALGCNGSRIVRTPGIDRLAREGVVFDQAFSACPLCTPYRGQLLTGRYSHANGAICNEYRLRDDQVTLPQALGRAGYRSAFVGKWHLGHGPYTPAKRYGFDDLIGYNCTHRYFQGRYFRNECGPCEVNEYTPRTETRMALEWIEAHRREHAGRPFCLVLSWGPPHWTGYGDGARDYGEYPKEYDAYDIRLEDIPANVPVPLREYERREWADYLAMTTSLDDCFGTLLAALDRWGLADNTILCFTSDHGDHLGAHGYGKPGCQWLPPYMRASKATPFEESAHIPFILRYPGKAPAGR